MKPDSQPNWVEINESYRKNYMEQHFAFDGKSQEALSKILERSILIVISSDNKEEIICKSEREKWLNGTHTVIPTAMLWKRDGNNKIVDWKEHHPGMFEKKERLWVLERSQTKKTLTEIVLWPVVSSKLSDYLQNSTQDQYRIDECHDMYDTILPKEKRAWDFYIWGEDSLRKEENWHLIHYIRLAYNKTNPLDGSVDTMFTHSWLHIQQWRILSKDPHGSLYTQHIKDAMKLHNADFITGHMPTFDHRIFDHYWYKILSDDELQKRRDEYNTRIDSFIRKPNSWK